MPKPLPNAAVTCSHCGAEITFPKPEKILKEFSALCSKCGRRKIYQSTDVHPAETHGA